MRTLWILAGAALALAAASPEARVSLAPRSAPAAIDRPSLVPADWLPFTDWPGCVFWLPGPSSAQPPPIAWEPCPPEPGIACRTMTTPWSDGQGPAIAPDVHFSFDERGHARLLVERLAINGTGDERSYVDWVAGTVDGPLEFALREAWPSTGPRCWALNRDVSPGGVALSLHGNGVQRNAPVDGLLVATFREPRPRVVYRHEAPGTSAWFLGAEWLVQNDYGRVTAHTLDFAKAVPIYDPSLSAERTPFDGRARIFGGDILFQVTDYLSASIWAFDSARGTHPLIAFEGDPSRGASNLGSDGKDMVWTEGAGKAPGKEGLYPEVWVMTAAYTTDPARLAARRLRRDLNQGVGTALLEFAVGCGYAGRPLANGKDVELVRLSDGAGFVLRGGDAWAWERVLGFTCEDVFLAVRSPTRPLGVARVPLSALVAYQAP